MEKGWAVKNRVLITGMLAVALTGAALLSLSLMGVSCATVELSRPRERQYDPNYGETAEDIRQHFNLRHGRYYNYFRRGAVYLAFGHYEKALDDFKEAIGKQEHDCRDARTYGMHFRDYFPHRESGVAFYFKGESQTDTTVKEQLYNQAIDELETSLSQEDSSRAKFYLNRARTSLWHVIQADTTPPTIQVERPIYTSRRNVWFPVTARDRESHVEEITINESRGDVQIERPSLFIELAEQEITRTVELTFGPRERTAVVEIMASDLAGNKSKPYSVLIILDTEAPTADVAIVENRTQPSGLVEAVIRARDDFGLRQIQVGEDPNDKADCDGALEYSATIAGVPKDGELVITVVDNAGNAVVAGIPVADVPIRARSVRASWPETPWTYPLARNVPARTWSQPLLATLLPGRDVPSPGSAMLLRQRGYAQIASLTASEEPWQDKTIPKFNFDDSVYRSGARGKEISADSFIVQGALLNAWPDVNEIRINGQKLASWKPPSRSYKGTAFRYDVNLADIPLGQTISIEVEAYCEDDPNKPCANKTLRVTRVDDGCLDIDAVYGLLVLPLPVTMRGGVDTSSIPGWEESIPDQVYKLLIEKLGGLRMSDRIPPEFRDKCGLKGRESSPGFRVYDVNQVYQTPSVHAWYKLRKYERSVAKDLRGWQGGKRPTGTNSINPQEGVDPSQIDLVIHGDVYVNTTGGLDVELRVTDVSDQVGLEFVKKGNRLLADYSFPLWKLQIGTQRLAWKVAEGLPRVWATVQLDDDDKRLLRINRGTKDRLFRRMELWLYKRDTPTNTRLQKHLREDISDVDIYRSWIECKDTKTCRRLQDDVIITK